VYDHARTRETVFAKPLYEDGVREGAGRGKRWAAFARSTQDPEKMGYRHHAHDNGGGGGWEEEADGVEGERLVDEEWMRQNMGDLDAPWDPEILRNRKGEEDDETGLWLFTPKKRKRWWRKVERTTMRSPFVPLGIRLTVLIFSVLALALAGSIWRQTDRTGCARGSSTWLSLIVDVVAVVYTIYITLDEYTSKPLGLRPPGAKLRLIFLDLVFIVFDSANLSLAFESLTDPQWACRNGIDDNGPVIGGGLTTCGLNRQICSRQKGLTGTLLVALVAWLATFTISVLRVLERSMSR